MQILFYAFHETELPYTINKRAAEGTFSSRKHTHLVHVLDLACLSCKHSMQLREAIDISFYATYTTLEGPILGQHAVVHLRRILELIRNSSLV